MGDWWGPRELQEPESSIRLYLEVPDGRNHVSPSGPQCCLALLVGDSVHAQLHLRGTKPRSGRCPSLEPPPDTSHIRESSPP